MKKIITALALTTLLFGCFGSGPAETPPEDTETPATNTEEVGLTDDLFVVLSAEILCLPTNNPEGSAENIEILAKAVLATAGVTEEAFSAYQQAIEADPESKNSLSLTIVGKMGDFCTVVEGVAEAEETETASETEEEESSGEGEEKGEGDDSGSDPLADLFSTPPAAE